MAITLISHTEVGSGGNATITLSSIPSTYDDLWLVCSIRNSDSGSNNYNLEVQFNSDTATNYSRTRLISRNGNTISTSRQQNGTFLDIGSLTPGNANWYATNTVYIPNYKNTSYNKQFIWDGYSPYNGAGEFLNVSAGLWRNTAAINSIKIVNSSATTFTQYSTFTLYGITKA